MNLKQLLKSTTNSGFPNIDETYNCTFVGFQHITRKSDGRNFVLLVVSANNSHDVLNEYTTIVQKEVNIPAEVRDEKFTITTERRIDSAYPRLIIED